VSEKAMLRQSVMHEVHFKEQGSRQEREDSRGVSQCRLLHNANDEQRNGGAQGKNQKRPVKNGRRKQ